MSYCFYCGNQLNGRFCTVCGKENPTEPSAEPTAEKPSFELNVDLSDIPDAPPAPPHQAAQTPPQQETTTPPPYGAPVPPMPPYPYPPYPFYTAPSQEKPVSVGGWIGRCLIPYIPIVGGLVYLIMLFIWMGDETKEETFRNWAKAQLLVMLIALGIVLFLWVLVLALVGSNVFWVRSFF